MRSVVAAAEGRPLSDPVRHLLARLAEHDRDTYRHGLRVATLCEALAGQLAWTAARRGAAHLAGLPSGVT
ncbi:hypothetical protein [Deinococcus pimensis]|uniref:hypothetical protein n=1 Tax=Deinococcus pimensis TaxID=309888 RepID=UPI0004895A2E|nr:hypothetical protein [Deinococcus pimensis]